MIGAATPTASSTTKIIVECTAGANNKRRFVDEDLSSAFFPKDSFNLSG